MAGWRTNELMKQLGIDVPIIQGPFGGGLSSVALAAAVSNAGGLGSYGAYTMEGARITEVARELRAATAGPFALNLWMPFDEPAAARVTPEEVAIAIEQLRPYYEEVGLPLPQASEVKPPDLAEQLEAVLEARPAVFSFIFGVPAPAVLEACRARGIFTVGTATHVDEAIALDAAGVDAIVASGFEAGGHRAAFLRPVSEAIALGALVPQIVDRVRVPVIAAGGIADGRGIAAALAWGASGVQVGSAFLACAESGASDAHRDALRSERARYTVLTRALSGRYGRAIPNRLVRALEEHPERIPAFPIQNVLTLTLRQEAARQGCQDLLALWAGQNAPLIRETRAVELLKFLTADTEKVLARLKTLI